MRPTHSGEGPANSAGALPAMSDAASTTLLVHSSEPMATPYDAASGLSHAPRAASPLRWTRQGQPRPALASGVTVRFSSEGLRAGQRAEVILGVVVDQNAGLVRGIDRHPAYGVNGQRPGHFLRYGGKQPDWLADVPEGVDAPGKEVDALEVPSGGSRGVGK